MAEETAPCCDWKEKYQALEKRMHRMQKEMNNMRDKMEKDHREVRNHCQHFYKNETSTVKELKQLKSKVDTLSNIVIRLEGQLDETATKLLNLQARSMRKNLVISGIPEPKKETSQQLLQAVQDFIRSKLQCQEDVPIKVWHRLNYVDNAEYRPVIIKLQNADQKLLLLSLGPNLKGLTNDKNRFFFLNEQLPDRMAEDKRYAQLWIKENRNKDGNQQLQMKIHRNKLRINNEPYQKKVKPPSAAEILRLDPEEVSVTNKAKTVYGDSTLLSGSEFISYAVRIHSVEDVRVAYRKLRIKYADATHIVSAYRLDPPNGPFNQEGSDDGEHGGGRCLLSVLREQSVVNVAIFVVRFYGGKQIGSQRFDAMRQLSLVALQKLGAITIVSSTATTRRTTRSMSVRGRNARTSLSQRSDSMQYRDMQLASQSQSNHSATMYRPTPASSPVVSPTNVLPNYDTQQVNPAGAVSQGDSEYDDPLSDFGQQRDQRSEDGDDEDDEEIPSSSRNTSFDQGEEEPQSEHS